MKPIKIRDGLFAVDWMWWSARDCVGIVIVNDEVTQTHKAYIGHPRIKLFITRNKEGISEPYTFTASSTEEEDVIYIAEHGAKFPLEIAKQLIASEDL